MIVQTYNLTNLKIHNLPILQLYNLTAFANARYTAAPKYRPGLIRPTKPQSRHPCICHSSAQVNACAVRAGAGAENKKRKEINDTIKQAEN